MNLFIADIILTTSLSHERAVLGNPGIIRKLISNVNDIISLCLSEITCIIIFFITTISNNVIGVCLYYIINFEIYAFALKFDIQLRQSE